MSETQQAAELQPGDSYEHAGTTVTVLREQERTVDLFGRPMLRYWASRADTGAEGWVMFGIAGVVAAVTGPGRRAVDRDGDVWLWCECGKGFRNDEPGWAYSPDGVTPFDGHDHLPAILIQGFKIVS